MFCKKCGWSNADSSAFCMKCGEKMIPASQTPEKNIQEQPQPAPQPEVYVQNPQPAPQPEAYVQNPQPAPQKKPILKIVLLIVAAVLVLAAAIGIVYFLTHKGSGKKDSGDNQTTEAAEEVMETAIETKDAGEDKEEKEEEETTENKTESKKKVVEVEVTAGDGKSFSDGKAWIQTKDDSQWMCIDTDGNILFTMNNCYSTTDFVNGYSLINNSYIIDDEGNNILDFVTDGYTLLNDDAFDVSRVLMTKYMDTYELAGTIMYVFNLETGESAQCNLSGSASNISYDEYTNFVYMGNGFYYLDDSSYSNTSLDLYDSINNKIVSVSIADSTSSTGYSYISDVTRIGDSSLIRLMLNNTLYIVDTETQTVKKKLDDVSSWSVVCYGEELISYSTNTQSEKNTWYYDIGTDELFQLTTSYDTKGYTVLDYENGYFLLSTHNDIGSLYIALVDKEGTTIIDPQKYGDSYYFTPKLHDGYYAYYCEGILYFADAGNPEEIKSAVLSESSINSIVVQSNGTVMATYNNNYNYAYTRSGDVIFENKMYTTADEDVQDGYRMIKNVANNTVEYWDELNKKLKIIKSEVYDPDDYKAAYRKALEQSTIAWGGATGNTYDSSYISFYLVDLDNDGTEEILLDNAYASHGEGYQALACNDNGEMKFLKATESITGYYPKHSVVATDYTNQGYVNVTYYKYENNEMTVICSYIRDDNLVESDEPVYTYRDSDSEEITEEDFNKLLKKAVGSEEIIKFNASDLKVNTEENRNIYLK